jgi:hypothetical protein
MEMVNNGSSGSNDAELANLANRWTNQNNFYRQIRNFRLDLTDMPDYIPEGAAEGYPTGIHWQVSQACTLQNIHIVMPPSSPTRSVRHPGIFMENGSGGMGSSSWQNRIVLNLLLGFVSDLTFTGGRVCFVAGSQQYTARNLRFFRCE